MNQIDLSDIASNSNELRNLIVSNPNLPIIVLAGGNANLDDTTWTCCYDMFAEIAEILDTDDVPLYCDNVYTDRNDFYDMLYEYLEDEYGAFDKTSLDDLFQKYIIKYESHWKTVIAVYVDN